LREIAKKENVIANSDIKYTSFSIFYAHRIISDDAVGNIAIQQLSIVLAQGVAVWRNIKSFREY
jgi:hypothetical protein